MAPTPKTPEELRKDIMRRIEVAADTIQGISLSIPKPPDLKMDPMIQIRSSMFKVQAELNRILKKLP